MKKILLYMILIQILTLCYRFQHAREITWSNAVKSSRSILRPPSLKFIALHKETLKHTELKVFWL